MNFDVVIDSTQTKPAHHMSGESHETLWTATFLSLVRETYTHEVQQHLMQIPKPRELNSVQTQAYQCVQKEELLILGVYM